MFPWIGQHGNIARKVIARKFTSKSGFRARSSGLLNYVYKISFPGSVQTSKCHKRTHVKFCNENTRIQSSFKNEETISDITHISNLLGPDFSRGNLVLRYTFDYLARNVRNFKSQIMALCCTSSTYNGSSNELNYKT